MEDFQFRTIEGVPFSLNDYRGHVILLVNTASQCGFTKQYAALQAVWERYKARGLVVIAVPSNDFGGQEPLNGLEIKRFCEVNYHVTFPITDKVSITGDKAHPFFRYTRRQFGFSGAPKWNFHKYLIDANGKVVDWFSPFTAPDSSKITTAIEKILPDRAVSTARP